jgi:hypothetical protein
MPPLTGPAPLPPPPTSSSTFTGTATATRTARLDNQIKNMTSVTHAKNRSVANSIPAT